MKSGSCSARPASTSFRSNARRAASTRREMLSMSGSALRSGQGQCEGAAAPGLAAHGQLAGHAAREIAGDGEAETDAVALPGVTRRDLDERLEDVLEPVVVDARTVVGHGDGYELVVRSAADLDRAALGRELERVAQQ